MDKQKVKHKLSRSFIFSSPPSANRNDSAPKNQRRITWPPKQKDQILSQILKLAHGNEQVETTTEINHLSDGVFRYKYLTNPFFKEKVKIIYEKQKFSDLHKFHVREDEEDTNISDIQGHRIKEFSTVKVQSTPKEKQQQEIVEKYQRLILKNA